MIVSLRLNSWLARLLTLLVGTAGCFALFLIGNRQHFIATLNDQGANADLTTLAAAVQRFPQSARLQAQWAAASLTQANDFEDSLAQAEAAAQQAVQLSSNSADYHLLLAAAKGVSGEQSEQEIHLRRAVALAPNFPSVRWQLANLLVRSGKLEESLGEFRRVADVKPALLDSAFDLLWEASNGNVEALTRATGELPRNRMALANFLLQQNRPAEATQVFSRIEVSTRASEPETVSFINRLLSAGQPDWARRLWSETRGAAFSPTASGEISNGGFETDLLSKLNQFDWQLKPSDYASPKFEIGSARTGQRALRIDFAGRDTTKLTDEIRQLLVLQPGTAYRFSCYVKTSQFRTPEGPHWVILNQANGQPVALTNRIPNSPAGTQSDWQALVADFTTPPQQRTYVVALQRTPQFSFDEPTKGTVWVDDCSLLPLTR